MAKLALRATLTVLLGCLCLQPTPVNSLPEDMTDDMFCTACLAMADVFDRKMTEKTFDNQEVKFFAALDEMCHTDNFRKYDYIPPKMVKACESILSDNDDEYLEREILRIYKTGKAVPSFKETEFFMCSIWSQTCINVDRDRPKGLPVPEEEMYGDTLKRMQKENAEKLRKPKPRRKTTPTPPAETDGDSLAPVDVETPPVATEPVEVESGESDVNNEGPRETRDEL